MAEGTITQMRDVAMDITRPMTITHKEVQYTIDGKGPFSMFMPISEFTADKAVAMVHERVIEWAKVVGRTVKS